MFGKCHKCGQDGLECQDDYASLKSGYWWQWRNNTSKERYKAFIANLLTSSPDLDASSVRYPYPIPGPYKCPIEHACNGGLDSTCGSGYGGPLCDVCSSGYYKQLNTCIHCPSKKWIVGQLLIIAASVFIIIAVAIWRNKSKAKTASGKRHLIDMFFSKLKIVIGFYQVTYGLLQVFSFVKWPGSLEVIGKYSGILQMNILQIAPVHCLFTGLHVDAFGNLFVMMGLNTVVIGISGVAYGVRKFFILRNRSLEDEEKSQALSRTKELMYRNLFFILYVTYLNTCSKTASVLPLACRKLCRDEADGVCNKYLKADYSIQCQGSKYDHFLIFAYISTTYVIALPVASFIVLWRQRRVVLAASDANIPQESSREMITGLRFLFENYQSRSWYWELVEMSRKVILTSGLILVGQESRSYIGLTWVIAGMYGVVFSWMRPIQDVFENRLMTTSLAVTVVNLGIGAVSRIPTENLPGLINSYADALFLKILVLVANTSVITLVLGRLMLNLYGPICVEAFADGSGLNYTISWAPKGFHALIHGAI